MLNEQQATPPGWAQRPGSDDTGQAMTEVSCIFAVRSFKSPHSVIFSRGANVKRLLPDCDGHAPRSGDHAILWGGLYAVGSLASSMSWPEICRLESNRAGWQEPSTMHKFEGIASALTIASTGLGIGVVLALPRKVSCVLPQAFLFGTAVAYCAYVVSCRKPREMALNESNSFPS